MQDIQNFSEWLKKAKEENEETLLMMCYENEEQTGIKTLLNGADNSVKNFVIIIGPEGGFSLEEADLAKSLGISSVSLGRRILRAETAAITAVSIVQYEKGDLGGEL